MIAQAKRAFAALIAALFAISMSASLVFATQAESTFAEGENQSGEQADPAAQAATNCTATIMYYEVVGWDVPGVEPDDTGRLLLGTRMIDGLREGDVLNAWDYVEDIPGHFFFDGWPLELTVTANPADNVIELNYFNRNDSQFTVNFYLMRNADLTADNWADALAPDDVEFIKLGSETFENQRFNSIVEGDAYQYQLDGTYVVDTYPAEIRLTSDPSTNVLNVLYVPNSMHLPDGIEVPDGYAVDDPDGSEEGDEALPDLPEDTEFDQDGIIDVLPEGTQPTDEIYQDFVGGTGSMHTAGLSQTGDAMAAWVIGTLAAALVVMGGLALLARRRTQRHAG